MPPPQDTLLRLETTPPAARLDVHLGHCFPALSRGALQRLIKEGHVRVDGRPVKATHRPRAGQEIRIHWPEPKPATAKPEPMALEVLYEDDHFLVLNKPPGLVVHPAAGHETGTLVNALIHHCAGQLSGIGGVARPGIVHRLDKDTSGCLVIAKNDSAHLALAAQFAGRTVEKTYLALVCGTVGSEHGEVRARIARHPSHRKRMAVTDGTGREAWTSYRVRQRFDGVTLVEVRLHTGRTHQVRVHFQHLGHPLVGDATYGKRQNARLADATGYTPPRQMLHAHGLAFAHPLTGKRVSFKAPWPADFAEAAGTYERLTAAALPDRP